MDEIQEATMARYVRYRPALRDCRYVWQLGRRVQLSFRHQDGGVAPAPYQALPISFQVQRLEFEGAE